MSPAIEIMQAIRAAGGELEVRGSSLRITGPKINPQMAALAKEWKSQLIDVLTLEKRLEKGAEVQWDTEQAGDLETPRYQKNEAHYESLLHEYEAKCQEPGIAAVQAEIEGVA